MGLNNDVTLKVGFDIDKFNAELKGVNSRLDSWATGVTNVFAGIASLQALKSIGTDMVEVTSQFQKFEAILTNTLGSNSQAQKALKQIEQFAANTPFEVSEITAAYVRWANMGLDPTIDRMQKIGDVASSLGAGFEQTAEAFKDLMVGQTKRIEEVGISATQTNGKIQLSFKGVNIEIEKNAAGVQKALDVYSQLNGVLGTSDAIAKTLGGKISNLSDAWDIFLRKIGTSGNGPISGTVVFLTELLNTLSGVSSGTSAIEGIAVAMNAGAAANDAYYKAIKQIVDDSGMTVAFSQIKEMTEGMANQNDVLLHLIPTLKNLGVVITGLNDVANGPSKQVLAPPPGQSEYMNKMTEAIKKQTQALEDYWKARRGPLDTKYVQGGKLKDSADINFGIDSAKVADIKMPTKFASPFSEEDLKAFADRAEQYGGISQKIIDLNEQLEKSMISMAASAATSLIEAFATGEPIGQAFLKTLANFAKQFGQMLITIGAGYIAAGAKAKGIRTIAAGVALVAGGAALGRATSSSGSDSVGGYGSAPRAMLNGNTQSSANAYNVNFTIRGRDLVGVMNTAQQDNYIIKGG